MFREILKWLFRDHPSHTWSSLAESYLVSSGGVIPGQLWRSHTWSALAEYSLVASSYRLMVLYSCSVSPFRLCIFFLMASILLHTVNSRSYNKYIYFTVNKEMKCSRDSEILHEIVRNDVHENQKIMN